MKSTLKKVPAAVAAGDSVGVDRFTVSLYGEDLDRLRAFRVYLGKMGVENVNRSLIVKLALRAAPLNAELTKHLQSIQAEDGRRTRHAKAKKVKSRSNDL